MPPLPMLDPTTAAMLALLPLSPGPQQGCPAAGVPLDGVAPAMRTLEPLFQQNGVEFRTGRAAGDPGRVLLSVANHTTGPVEVGFIVTLTGGEAAGEVNLGRRCVRLGPNSAMAGDSAWAFDVPGGADATLRVRHLSIANLPHAPEAPKPAAGDLRADPAPSVQPRMPTTTPEAAPEAAAAAPGPQPVVSRPPSTPPAARSGTGSVTEAEEAELVVVPGTPRREASPVDLVLRAAGGIVMVAAGLLLVPPVAAAVWLLFLLPAAVLRRDREEPARS